MFVPLGAYDWYNPNHRELLPPVSDEVIAAARTCLDAAAACQERLTNFAAPCSPPSWEIGYPPFTKPPPPPPPPSLPTPGSAPAVAPPPPPPAPAPVTTARSTPPSPPGSPPSPSSASSDCIYGMMCGLGEVVYLKRPNPIQWPFWVGLGALGLAIYVSRKGR